MFSFSYWIPLLIFVGLWLLAWQFFKRMAAGSEKARREMMKEVPHDLDGPDPTVYP